MKKIKKLRFDCTENDNHIYYDDDEEQEIWFGDCLEKEHIVYGLDDLKKAIEFFKPSTIGSLSDGYHTFDELYNFRRVYNIALFNEWAKAGLYSVHKSRKHYDGDLCFGGGWFIVVAVLPSGQISNHYENKYWDDFKIPEMEKALFPFDGHTPQDVLKRVSSLWAE